MRNKKEGKCASGIDEIQPYIDSRSLSGTWGDNMDYSETGDCQTEHPESTTAHLLDLVDISMGSRVFKHIPGVS